MTDKEYKLIVQKMLVAFADSKAILTSAIQEEYDKNLNKIDFDSVVQILSNYSNIEPDSTLDSKKFAVVCKGDPEVTIQLLLTAIRNNINITLVTLNYHIINNCIFTLYDEIMQELKIPNTYINYSEDYFEQDIIEKSKIYDKVIYIGSYFDYQNFEYFCDSENLLFWNDRNIKVLMNRDDYKEEYKDMVKYCYSNNIELEVYEDEDEFFEELTDGECAIIYTEEDEEQYLCKTNARIIKFNNFNIEDFKFNVNDLILSLDFSVKV